MPRSLRFCHLPFRESGRRAASISSSRIARARASNYLWDNTQKFLAAAKKRPEIARMNLTFSPSVPQMFAAVDKDKVFKLGISIEDVYRALQTLLGGYYVNQFNRFGRVWKVFVEAEPAYRTRATDVGQFYVRNKAGGMVPCRRWSICSACLAPSTRRASTNIEVSRSTPSLPRATVRPSDGGGHRSRERGAAARYGHRMERNLLPAIDRRRRRGDLRRSH